MNLSKHFKPASEATINHFNKWGAYPYHAIQECEVRTDGHAPVELTIIKHDNGGFGFAHGCIIEPDTFKTIKGAQSGAFRWYESNYHQFKLASSTL